MTIFSLVIQGNTLRFDRDTAFPLNIHGIKHLCGHFTVTQTITQLYKTVSQSRLAMVYMGNNGKISNVLLIHALLRL